MSQLILFLKSKSIYGQGKKKLYITYTDSKGRKRRRLQEVGSKIEFEKPKKKKTGQFEWELIDPKLIDIYEKAEDEEKDIAQSYLRDTAKFFNLLLNEAKDYKTEIEGGYKRYNELLKDYKKNTDNIKKEIIDKTNKIEKVKRDIKFLNNLENLSEEQKNNLELYKEDLRNLESYINSYNSSLKKNKYQKERWKARRYILGKTYEFVNAYQNYKTNLIKQINNDSSIINKDRVEILDIGIKMGSELVEDIVKKVKEKRKKVEYDTIKVVLHNKENNHNYIYTYVLRNEKFKDLFRKLVSKIKDGDYNQEEKDKFISEHPEYKDENYYTIENLWKKELEKNIKEKIQINPASPTTYVDMAFDMIEGNVNDLRTSGYSETNVGKPRSVVKASIDGLKAGIKFYNTFLNNKIKIKALTSSPVVSYDKRTPGKARQELYKQVTESALKNAGINIDYSKATTDGHFLTFVFKNPINYAIVKSGIRLENFFMKSESYKERVIKILREILNKDKRKKKNEKM